MRHAIKTGQLAGAARTAHSRQRAERASPRHRSQNDEWLTVEQVCDELQVSRRTFDRWRARRTGPRCIRLGGNGPVRIKRCWLEDWIDENGPGAA
jgi:predicted DNA-binding transcriptional regulator AlpA